ncbi:MAG: 30S ribosomal protein S9 [Phycisphaeraceae bacterium]
MTDTITPSGNAPTSSTAPVVEETQTQPLPDPEPAVNGYWWGTGRRKSSIARVRIRPGDGKFIVNGKELDVFFTEMQHVRLLNAPLKISNIQGNLDVIASVRGGGYTGQAGAVLLGLARALKKYDPSLEHGLRVEGFLTRDPREVERKKYGQSGARRKFQFSKR